MTKRVFMVDDKEWTIAKLQELLVEEGYAFDYASTLEVALSCLAENEYDAIISDHDMEGLDGTQFLQMLQGIDTEDAEVEGVIDEYFTDAEYAAFVEKLRSVPLVLFTADQFVTVEDVFVARKNKKDDDNYTSEREIVAYLNQALGLQD